MVVKYSSKSACRPMCVGKVASGASRGWSRGVRGVGGGLKRCHTNQLQPFHCPVPRAQSADKQIAGKWATIMLLANVGSPHPLSESIKPIAPYTKKRFSLKISFAQSYYNQLSWTTHIENSRLTKGGLLFSMSVDLYMVSEQATVIHSAVHAWKPLKPLHSRSCLAW